MKKGDVITIVGNHYWKGYSGVVRTVKTDRVEVFIRVLGRFLWILNEYARNDEVGS